MVRNIAIVLAIAALVALWQGAEILVAGLSQIIFVLFLVAIIAFGINYFRRRQLAWLVLSDLQKTIIIGAAVGVVVLVLGYPFIAPIITPLGVVGLIAVLAVMALWVIRESQRFR